MNIIKGIVALSIFLCLFAGAWILDHNTKRDYITIKSNDHTTKNKNPNPNNVEIKMIPQHDPFQPREYIRIRQRTQKETGQQE